MKNEEELRVQRGPDVDKVSFHARPDHNVHSTLGVDTGATGPRWRMDYIEGGEVGRGGKEWKGEVRISKDTSNKEPFV
jgi:hypothetical protein